MGLFSGKKPPEELRRKKLAHIIKSAQENDSMAVAQGILHLREDGHMNAPEIPFVLNGVVEALAQHDVVKALGSAIWMIHTAGNAGVREILSEKALNLMERVDTSSMNNLATVAMAANVIVSNAATGSALEKRGVAAWKSAIERLAARRDGLNFAFAAASNAALGTDHLMLRDLGRETWRKIVDDVAKTDTLTASIEAIRVMTGYNDFGQRAMPFRMEAVKALKKIKDAEAKPKAP